MACFTFYSAGTVIAVFRLGELSGLPLVSRCGGRIGRHRSAVGPHVRAGDERDAGNLHVDAGGVGGWAELSASRERVTRWPECVLCRLTFLVWLDYRGCVAVLFARRAGRGVRLAALFLLVAAVIAPWLLRNWPVRRADRHHHARRLRCTWPTIRRFTKFAASEWAAFGMPSSFITIERGICNGCADPADQ
jgi:hypothetical protein